MSNLADHGANKSEGFSQHGEGSRRQPQRPSEAATESGTPVAEDPPSVDQAEDTGGIEGKDLPDGRENQYTGITVSLEKMWAAYIDDVAAPLGQARGEWIRSCVGGRIWRHLGYERRILGLFNRMLHHALDLAAAITHPGSPQVALDRNLFDSTARIDDTVDTVDPVIIRWAMQSSFQTLVERFVGLRQLMAVLTAGTSDERWLQSWTTEAIKRAQALALKQARIPAVGGVAHVLRRPRTSPPPLLAKQAC